VKPELGRKSSVVHRVYSERLVEPGPAAGLDREAALALYRLMLTARLVDEVEADLAARGEASFHIPGSGHEAMAVLALSLTPDDWLHLHYRDKALMLARGTPPRAFFDALVGNAASPSAGRQMAGFMGDPALGLLSGVVLVGNQALQAVGVAAAVKDRPGRPIVVCSMGDGTTQQGEVLEAIGEAVRAELPVLFVVEDNAYAISTPTAGRTFHSLPDWCVADAPFFGLPIHRWDGRDPAGLLDESRRVVDAVRLSRRPALAVLSVDRLSSHTNADDERVYRPAAERAEAAERGDPVRRLGDWLVRRGVAPEELDALRAEVRAGLDAEAAHAVGVGPPRPALDAKAPLPAGLGDAASEVPGHAGGTRLTMLEAIRETLRHHLAADPRVSLQGQDIEDPKGDVFGVTRGLSRAFPGRVRNAALSESTIVGTAVGRALVGERPVAMIQFADFLPLAYNQIAAELGSLHWRTDGRYACPLIVMAPCGAYRPGLGPFHAQTLEGTLAHLPGIDVLMPATAGDAAGLLNAAFASGRPTVFLYPKSILNDRDRTTSDDVSRQLAPIGRARRVRPGDDLTLVAWGSTVRLAEEAADALADAGRTVDLIDLRSLSPWDSDLVGASARRTGRLLVVHEDNHSCGLGAEVVATVAEESGGSVRCRRVTRPDTHIPFNYANQLEVLPSLRGVLGAAADLLGLELTWEAPTTVDETAAGDRRVVRAMGTSPADQAVRVLSWLVAVGHEVAAGGRVAELEADKATFEMVSPAAGRVARLLVPEGETVRVGAPLLELDAATSRRSRPAGEAGFTAVPRLRAPAGAPAPRRAPARAAAAPAPVGIGRPAVVFGSRTVDNDELIARFPGRHADEVRKRTGISRRRRLADDESTLSLALRASRSALDAAGLTPGQLDAVICSTTTPPLVTPSLACLILHGLAAESGAPAEVPAHDVMAACSGYLYALAAAYDLTRTRPEARVLVVTADALSTLTDPDDFDTAFLFGDAATATIVQGPDAIDRPFALLRRPHLAAKGEAGRILRVPAAGTGHLRMEGLHVYAEAVRQMIAMLARACDEQGLTPQDLDLVVPHQANARIIGDIRARLNLPAERMYLNLGEVGNTSSSSIPACLAEVVALGAGKRVGLTAFGGGYTFAAAILETC
jgi:2-oxoisovalerate dehydrogenase E1 component